jgi:hypothetical protein
MSTVDEEGNVQAPDEPEDPSEIQMNGDEPESSEGLSKLVNDPEGNFSYSIDNNDHLINAINQVPVPGEEPVAEPTKTGVTVTHKGITEHGKKMAGGFFGQQDVKAQGESDRLQAQYEQQKAGLDKGFNEQRDALKTMAAVDAEHHTYLRDLHQQAMEFNQTQSNLEAMAQVHAKADAQQYMNQYQQEMVGVKQLMMQSGNPLGGLDTGGGLALAGAAFIQGFLGARGVNINVTGQIDHWVEREMQHHQQMISNRQGLANQQLTLYGLAKQNANDEWEARQRLRGFVTEGMKAQLLMESDRWQSAAAKADAQAKAAQLDIDQQSTMIGLQSKVEKQSFEYKQLGIQAAAAQAKASVEYGHLKVEQDRERRLAAAVKPGKPAQQLISDPSTPELDAFGNIAKDPVTGKPVHKGAYLWAPDETADHKVRESAVTKAAQLKSDYQYASDAVDKLLNLRKPAEEVMGLPDAVKSRSSEYQAYKAEQTRLITIIRRAATGLSFTKGESETYEQQLADDKIAGDSMSKLVYDFSEDLRSKYNAQMNSLVGAGLRKATPDERKAAGGYQTYDDLDQATGARNAINTSEAGPIKSAIDSDVRAVVGGGSRKTDKTAAGQAGFFDIPTLKQPTKGWLRFVGDGIPQPEAATRIEDIARGIIKPELYREMHSEDSTIPQRNEILRGRLKAALEDIGAKGSGPEARYAAALANYVNGIYKLGPAKSQGAVLDLMDTLGLSTQDE